MFAHYERSNSISNETTATVTAAHIKQNQINAQQTNKQTNRMTTEIEIEKKAQMI